MNILNFTNSQVTRKFDCLYYLSIKFQEDGRSHESFRGRAMSVSADTHITIESPAYLMAYFRMRKVFNFFKTTEPF